MVKYKVAENNLKHLCDLIEDRCLSVDHDISFVVALVKSLSLLAGRFVLLRFSL